MGLLSRLSYVLSEYPKVYIAVGLRGTIVKPTFTGRPCKEFYPIAKKALQGMSKDKRIILILWTSEEKELQDYLDFFKESGINFAYVNENPEIDPLISKEKWRTKFFFDLCLDDRSGFDPVWDWIKLWLFFKIF